MGKSSAKSAGNNSPSRVLKLPFQALLQTPAQRSFSILITHQWDQLLKHSWTSRHVWVVTTATQEAQLKTEEGWEEHKLSVCYFILFASHWKQIPTTAIGNCQSLVSGVGVLQDRAKQWEAEAQHCIETGCLGKSFQVDASRAKLRSVLSDRPLKM